MNNLKQELQATTAALPGNIAVIVKNSTGQIIFATNNTSQVFKSASLIKLGIAAYLLNHHIDLQQTVTLTAADLVPGGVLYHLGQRQWSVQDLLDLMLSVSDNTAANVLLKLAGFKQVQTWLASAYPQIHLGRFLMAPAKDENLISAATALTIFEDLLSSHSSVGQLCQTAMFNQTTRSKLIGAIPEDHSLNKTGELADTEHDVARILRNHSFYDCCFLSRFDHWPARLPIIRGMNKIGALLYQALA